MKFQRIVDVKCLLIFCLICFSYHAIAQNNEMFRPVLGDGADPWVIKYNGYYYMCQSVNNKNGHYVTVSKSDKLSRVTDAKITVWHAPSTGWNSNTLWAPELHHIGKKWYIYYAAGKSGPPFIYQRSGVLESVTDDAQGTYIDKGMLQTGADKNDATGTIWAIDFTVTTISGQLYGLWSGWYHNSATDKTQQNLYIAKMSNLWTISSDRVKISSPAQPWETGGPLNLNEGPEFLQRDGSIFIIYSTRESWTPQYRLGQLKLRDLKHSLLDPGNWEKSGPVFTGTDNVYGVGHASFTKSEDDKQWWIIYHTKKFKADSWDREIRLQPFTWNSAGNPDFGQPVNPGEMIRKPSGEN